MRTALALSPHLDDAVFSCGGTLHLLARAGWRVIVGTLFTRSMPDPQGFALACQLDKGLGPEVDYMALRRTEDAAAMRALGVEAPLHLSLPEAPHRGYHSARALFEPPLTVDAIGVTLRDAVAGLVSRETPDLVLAPQAIGGHVDHVQLVRVLDRADARMVWWRDFPYTLREARPAEPFADEFGRLAEVVVPLDAEAVGAKEAACGAYASQLGYQFQGREGLRRKLAEAGAAEQFTGLAVTRLRDAIAGPI